MKALTVRQPWASLIVHGHKTIETRSRATTVRGRLAIHAGKARPSHPAVGENSDATMFGFVGAASTPIPLPLGAIVGSAELVGCIPIVGGDGGDDDWSGPILVADEGGLVQYDALLANARDRTGEAPLGDFTPGRWAWLLADAKPITERCPWCWGRDPGGMIDDRCLRCDGAGRLDPVALPGRQGWWDA